MKLSSGDQKGVVIDLDPEIKMHPVNHPVEESSQTKVPRRGKTTKKVKWSSATVVEWVSLILLVVAFVCTLTLSELKRRTLLQLELWKWELLISAFTCGNLLSGMLFFLVDRNCTLRKPVLYFIYELRQTVQNFLGFGFVLIVWHFVIVENVEREVKNNALTYITKVLICLLVASSVWFVKTLLVKVLASSFHATTYFDRIQDSLFNQFIVETLSGPPHNPEDDTAQVQNLHKMNRNNISAGKMKEMINVIRRGFMSTFDRATAEDESSMLIKSEFEAKVAAEKIFHNVARPQQDYICLEDLLRFMSEDEATKTMSLLEGGSEKNTATKSALEKWVVTAFRQRKALALTLDDTKTAVKKLHRMVNMNLSVIIVTLWLIILGIATSHIVYVVGGQIIVAVFMLGDTCKTIFEATIFLFVTHPFDVGDRCEVNGVQMVVEKMDLLTTVFLGHDNEKIYYPNSTLATLPIRNYYRSPDRIEFSIPISTPTEKIALMKQRITMLVEGNREHWHPGPSILLKAVDDMKLKWAIKLMHTMNHQEMEERWARRAQLAEDLCRMLGELDMLPVGA